MLYPQANSLRPLHSLDGFWEFRPDAADTGLEEGWEHGFSAGTPIAVPASWNDQLSEWRDLLGPAWYQLRFDRPASWPATGGRLRFGSVNYLARVWLNGSELGEHEGGHLPFEFSLDDELQPQDNLLVVRVDGRLAPDRVPPGKLPRTARAGAFQIQSWPNTTFDFFPFCGIHRPVLLYATAPDGIADLTVRTELAGDDATVSVTLDRWSADSCEVRLTLTGPAGGLVTTVESSEDRTELSIAVPQGSLWSPASPTLYELTAELWREGAAFDRYRLPIGIRTIAVDGARLLLNGAPISLRGFGRHEDFPVVGRGLLPALIVRDYELLRWVGANSFRTSHYPYSEQMMQLADRLGVLVIDETPAVGLFFTEPGLERRNPLCLRFTEELIDRDKNHPSVIMRSIANEPQAHRPEARTVFEALYARTRALDTTRLVTHAGLMGLPDLAQDLGDVICLNRYQGWYTHAGQLDAGIAELSAELDTLYAQLQRPILLTEFGADTVPGWHADPPEMWSEEYEDELLRRYLELLACKPYIAGVHIWNLCDFKTGQMFMRPGGMNWKGVFTRARRPKLVAHTLRRLWNAG